MLRMLIVLGLVITVIPANDAHELPASPSAVETWFAAERVWSDIAGFCERNPATCETGAHMASRFQAKARTGAQMVLDYLESEDDAAATDAIKTGATQ